MNHRSKEPRRPWVVVIVIEPEAFKVMLQVLTAFTAALAALAQFAHLAHLLTR